MIKELLIKAILIIAVFLFLLDDILNWDLVKEHVKAALSEKGIQVEQIEKLTMRGATLSGIETRGHRIDRLYITYNTVHLCANALKYAFKRPDYLQEFTLHEAQLTIGSTPITLKTPLACCATPENTSHETIELKIGLGFAVIHPGDTSTLSQKIELYQVPLHLAKGKVSGVIELSKKHFDLKYRSTSLPKKITAHAIGSWDPLFQITFKGNFSMDKLRRLPFHGKVSPSFDNFSHSALEVHGDWSGTLKQLYSFLDKEFKLVQGNVAAHWEIKGLLSDPTISGNATLSEGTFEVPAIGLYLKNLSANIQGNNNYWVVKDLHANDTEFTHGVVEGSGWIEFPPQSPFNFNLNMQIKNIAVLMMENLTGLSSGDLQLKGDRTGAKLMGKGLVHGLKLILDKSTGNKKAPLDIVFKDEHTTPLPQPYPVIYDVALTLEKPAVIEGENLHTTWTGAAHLGGTVDDLRLKGELKLGHGEYCLNGRDIAIKEGAIRFDGNILKETTVFAIATMELKELIAEIIIRGHLDTLSLTLRSNPPLPQREILSWILFNQGAKHITALQGEQLNRSLSEFTKGEGPKNPLTELQGMLGIDRIDLDRRGFAGDEEVSLKLGKYLSKNLFVGVSKGINADVNRIGFEASLNEHWKVQGEIGDNAEGQMHLKWKNDY